MPLFEVETDSHIIITWAENEDAVPDDKLLHRRSRRRRHRKGERNGSEKQLIDEESDGGLPVGPGRQGPQLRYESSCLGGGTQIRVCDDLEQRCAGAVEVDVAVVGGSLSPGAWTTSGTGRERPLLPTGRRLCAGEARTAPQRSSDIGSDHGRPGWVFLGQ